MLRQEVKYCQQVPVDGSHTLLTLRLDKLLGGLREGEEELSLGQADLCPATGRETSRGWADGQ